MRRYKIVFSTMIGLTVFACKQKQLGDDISLRLEDIQQGKVLFDRTCIACHDFMQNSIGPYLGGLTRSVSTSWIADFIQSPQEMIEAGDRRATRLFKDYGVYMPSFNYSEEEIGQIIAYMHTYESPLDIDFVDSMIYLDDPIEDTIPLSDLVIDLQYFTTIPPSSEEMPMTRISKIEYSRGDDRAFVSDHRGKVYVLDDSVPAEYLDMTMHMPAFIAKPGLGTGLGSIALHPNFASNGIFFLTHTEPEGSDAADFTFHDSIDVALQWILTEWTATDPDANVFEGSIRELMRIDMTHSIHGVQELTFNTTAGPSDQDYGMLYMSVGDGGAIIKGHYDIPDGPTQIWGSIIRIDPEGHNGRNGNYGIPGTNPFAADGDDDTLPEIYAHGFRNPHRTSWDSYGRMLASGIGERNIEEINIILPGHDYGWPHFEGTFAIMPAVTSDRVLALSQVGRSDHVSWPAAQYDHNEGRAVCGGFEYTGNLHPNLSGKYIFGDITTGRLFYLLVDDLQIGRQAQIYEWRVSIAGEILSLRQLCQSNRVDLRFARDHRGEMYLFTKADGKIYSFGDAPVL